MLSNVYKGLVLLLARSQSVSCDRHGDALVQGCAALKAEKSKPIFQIFKVRNEVMVLVTALTH